MAHFTGPEPDCALCPRLADFRAANRAKFPDKFNSPVPAFGPLDAEILVVGLAPGLRGANFSGRPFTGDYAGDVLYPALLKFGYASGQYGADPDDGLCLTGARITNAVRCVPPENKPIGSEMANCLPWLAREIQAMPNLRAILCLGLISHKQVIKALEGRQVDHPFGHRAVHDLGGVRVFDSYHCSRYNINTGRLTVQMFDDVMADLQHWQRENS